MKMTLNKGEFDRQIREAINKCIKAGGDLVEKSEQIVTVVTDKLMEESIKRSPKDEAFLEESHERLIKKSAILENIEGHVFIPANSPASDYAMYMHEGTYNLGKESQIKQDAVGVKVGRKFLERAFDDNVRAFGLYILKELRGFFKYGH